MKEIEWVSRNTNSLILEKMNFMLVVNVSQSPKDFYKMVMEGGGGRERSRIITGAHSSLLSVPD